MKEKMCCALVIAAVVMTGWSMPSRSELKKVQASVNELMAEDISAMKSGAKTPADAAAKAMEYAGMAESEASRFLLYKGAFGLFVQGGKYDEAIATLNTLNENVKNIPDKVLAEIVREKLKRISKKSGGAIFAYYAQLDRRVRYGEEKSKLEKQLKASPSDREARRALAQAQAALDEWPAALASFTALGGDEAKAAKAERDGKNVEAADFWWGYSADEDLQDEFRAHAAVLYQQAIQAGTLTGLKKTLVEKRLAKLTPKVGAPAPKSVAQTTRAPEPKAAPAETPPPVAVAPVVNGKPIILALGGGEKLEMLPCPAGEFTMGYANRDYANANQPHQVKISRPFYLAKIPTTRGQWKKMGMSGPNRQELVVEDADALTSVEQKTIWEACSVLTKRFRRQLPKGYVVRLPTEAEWEYALKAGGTDELYSKDRLSFEELETLGPGPFRAHKRHGRGGENGPFTMHPMPCGKYKPNKWGFYDLLGNVRQITLDCAECLVRKYPSGECVQMPDGWFLDATDPLCWLYQPGKSVDAVCRGGCGYFVNRQEPKGRAGFANIAHRMPAWSQFFDFSRYYGVRFAIGPDLLTERNLPQPK